MGKGKYICYKCGEDLTKKVLALKGDGGDYTAAFGVHAAAKRTRRKRKWRVVVTCSKGDKNVFEGEY